MNKKILIVNCILISLLLSVCFFQQVTAETPVGISGRVKVNGVYTNDLTVTIKNLQTEHTAVTTTSSTINGNGFYSCAMMASQGNALNITCTYEEKNYYNEIAVDIDETIQWLNLSIITNPGENSPIANFTWFPSTMRADMMISFNDLSTDLDEDIVTYIWSIAGTIYTEHNPYHIFVTSGTKTITLTVTDAMDHVDICSRVITVLPAYGVGDHPPVANFTYTPLEAYTDRQISFSDTSTDVDDDIITYSWKIDDVSVATTKNPTYIFIHPGNFSIKLTVTDSNGNTDDISRLLIVYAEDLVPQYNITVKVKYGTQALPTANVSIYRNATYVGSDFTNETGVALLQVNETGEYRIIVKYAGVSDEKNVTVSTSGLIVLFNVDVDNGADGNGNPFNKQTPGFEIGVFIISLIAAILIFVRLKKGKNSP
jgi:PKD repeat protein